MKIPNKRNGQQVLIRKKASETVGGETVYLNNAVFDVSYKQLGMLEEDEAISKGRWTSETKLVNETEIEGVIYSGELELGTYYLVEAQAPDGYNLLSNPVKIKVDSTGVSVIGGAGTVISEGNGIYTIEISNSAGFELPETGSTGTNPYTVGGAMLAATAAFLMYGYSMRRRKSERRSK